MAALLGTQDYWLAGVRINGPVVQEMTRYNWNIVESAVKHQIIEQSYQNASVYGKWLILPVVSTNSSISGLQHMDVSPELTLPTHSTLKYRNNTKGLDKEL